MNILIPMLVVTLLAIGVGFPALLSQQSREQAVFDQHTREDAVIRALILHQLDEDRISRELAAQRAIRASEDQFFAKYDDFRIAVSNMMIAVQAHKTDLKSSAKVDRTWKKWRSDEAWPGPKQ